MPYCSSLLVPVQQQWHLLQAVMVRETLIYILQHHLLTISNCCYVLETARQASVGSLTQRALQLLCGNFMQVLQCDGNTLADLSKETLLLVLCSDSLQVRTLMLARTLTLRSCVQQSHACSRLLCCLAHNGTYTAHLL